MTEESYVDKIKAANPIGWAWGVAYKLGYWWHWVKDVDMADGLRCRTKKPNRVHIKEVRTMTATFGRVYERETPVIDFDDE